jgi:hypothetical protein
LGEKNTEIFLAEGLDSESVICMSGKNQTFNGPQSAFCPVDFPRREARHAAYSRLNGDAQATPDQAAILDQLVSAGYPTRHGDCDLPTRRHAEESRPGLRKDASCRQSTQFPLTSLFA